MTEFRVLQRWHRGDVVLAKKGKEDQPLRVWTTYRLQTRSGPDAPWVDVPVVYQEEGADEITEARDG